MLYQDYKQKIKKVVDVLRFIRRIRVPIIVTLATVLVLLGAYLTTKGVVYGAVLADNTIEYGDMPSFSASALFSQVRYEYRSEGSEEWSGEVPTLMGNYFVRAVSEGSFGTRYGKEQAFTIGARRIDVSVREERVIYGDSPTVTADLVFGDTISCTEYVFENTLLSSTSVAPVREAVKITNPMGKDVTGSYIINVKSSPITFEKRDITVTTESREWEYNGITYVHDVWEQSGGECVFGDRVVHIVGSFTGIIASGSALNDAQFKVVRTVGDVDVDVTHQYRINKSLGTLSVTKKPIVVYPNGGEYIYDGTAHLDKGFTIDPATPLAEGDTPIVKEAPSIVNVGSIDNILVLTILDGDGESDVTDNYSFTYAGEYKLRVVQRELLVQTPTYEAVYDGTEHTATDCVTVGENSLVEGHGFTAINPTAVINAETVENKMELKVLDKDGNDVTGNYKLSYENGTLTVTQRKINITSADLNGVYSGEEQFAHTVSSPEGELCQGHTIVPVFDATVKNSGAGVQNTFTVAILDAEGQDVTDNYARELHYGTLYLERLPVSIKTGSATKKYDGVLLKLEDTVYTGENKFHPSHRLEAVGAPSIINVERVDNIFALEIYEGEEKVTYNYDITYEYGSLEILHREIRVTALGLVKKYYDAQPFEKPGYHIGIDGLAVNEYAQVVTEVENGDYVSAGQRQHQVVSVEIYNASDVRVTDNYNIERISSPIQVGFRPIVVMSSSFASPVYYDGERHTLHSFYVVEGMDTGLPIVEGHEVEAEFLDTSFVEFATNKAENAFKVTRIYDKATDENVTSNYDITTLFGELELQRRPVTFISSTIPENTVIYDGQKHTLEAFTVSTEAGMGLVSGHLASAEFYSSITNAGSCDNEFSVTEIFDPVRYMDVTLNYEISCLYGKLSVSKRPVTFTSQSGSKVYNSVPLTNTEVLIGGMGMADGQVPVFKDFTQLTSVNTETVYNSFTLDYIYKYTYPDFEYTEINPENYEITYEYTGELTVTQRPVTVTVNSNSKMYDGTALTPNGYFVPICRNYYDVHDGLLPMHTLSMELSGSQTYAGSSAILFSLPTVVDNETTEKMTSNYDITVIGGTLTVDKRPITLTLLDQSKEYDGAPLYTGFDADICVGGNGLASTDIIHIETNIKSITNVGYETTSITSWKMENNRVDVTNCYEVTSVGDGSLTVTPREITVTIIGADKEYYDGAEIKSSGYSVERLLLALGHRCELELVGSQIDVGTSYATAKDGKVFIYDGLGEDITYNYSYTIIDGELTVAKKRPITFVSCDAEILYNGEEYTGANSYKISLENGSMGLATGRADYESVVFTHEPFIDAGTYDNTFDVSILFEGVDVSYNYEITKLEGTVIINRVKIYVYTGSDTKVFDGTALKCGDISFTCDDLPSTQRIVAETDGEIIYVGTAENTYKLQVYRDDDPVSMDNFILIDELGSLEITPLELHIVSNSDQKTYDGSPLVNKGYTSNWESTEAYAKGELSLGVAITGTRTDVGRSNNTFFARVYEKNGDEVPKGNCIITTETGTLTVYAPPTVFESYDSFGIYDGIDKSYHYAELVEDGVGYVSPEHKYEFLFEGECIDAGTYENRFTVKLTSKETGEDVSEFYPDISYIYGTVSISKRVMEIETPKNKYQYTGEIIYAPSEIQTPNNDFNILNSLYDDCEYTWSVDPITDVYVQMSGEQVYYTIPLEKLHIYLNGTELDKSNFEITIREGYMKVAEKLLTITVYKVVKAYSGKPVSYYADDWRFDATQLPEGYTLDFILEGSLTEVGELDLDELMDELYAKGNVHVYDENGVDVTSSYEFKLAGTPLTVTPRKLQITAGSSEKYYDGTPLTDESYSVTGGSLAKGHEIRSCHVYGSRTDVGTGLNSAGLAVIVDKATGEIVTDNYEIDYQYGYLTVLEAEQ